MVDLTARRMSWGLLRTLHPLFLCADSLPNVDDADHLQDRYGVVDGSTPCQRTAGSADDEDEVDHLKNEITTLRNDLKLNIIKQQLIETDQLIEDDSAIEGLQVDLQTLLEQLEDLVDPAVLCLEEVEYTLEPESLASFPRLITLRKVLQSPFAAETNAAEIESEPKDSVDGEKPAYDYAETDTALTQMESGPESSWSRRYSASSVAQAAGFIRFPQDVAKIESCRRTVSRFGMALDRTLDSGVSWAMEPQTLDYTSQDLEAIQHAHDFATTCTSLFKQMVEGIKCETPHQAKLHLSGFKQDQLQMRIRTCKETDWVPAVFTRSLSDPAPEPFCFDHICSPTPSLPEGSGVLQLAFNAEGMWASNDTASLDTPNTHAGEQSLDHLLVQGDGLSLKYRKLAGVLLAASVFQLSNSPWIEHHLGPDCIFMPSPDNKRLQQWCPRVLCSLAPKIYTGLQSDSIAAFGVLVLELEANRKASWTADDEDWLTGEKSNHVRLARILKTWEDLVSDEYRGVAKACLEFDSLIEGLDHPDIVSERKGLAVIYKCILEPLFRHVTKSFGNLAPIFKGMFGPGRSLTAPMNISSSVTAKRVLFDDGDDLPKAGDQVSASIFLKGLTYFFQKIRTLHDDLYSLTQYPTHERIRIAVLDSGVDDTDSVIRPAIKFGRINTQKSRSFVGRPEEWQQDCHGHGTHVTQLLLKTAPAAEIYVGKICSGKVINDEFLPGIAKAIDWAVKECDAHIISISFGFEDENDLIDAAVDNAIDAGKLIIAAASNNGGLSGRARPARYEGVLCIHATDGKGNKGGMNPSPQANRDNFATLGVAVPAKWKGADVWKSGTSFAVPIAAGFAADVLEFAKYRCANLKARKLKMLHRKRGMQAVFRKMAEERDGYDFIHPVRLWKDWQDARAELQAAKAIEDIMEDL